MTKNSMRWTLASLILAAATTAGFACDDAAKAADVKDATVAAHGDAKGCDMPCCAHAKDAADVKPAAEAKLAADVKPVAAAAADMPCAAHNGKGCPKKSVAVAKAEEPKDAPKAAEPVADPGTHR